MFISSELISIQLTDYTVSTVHWPTRANRHPILCYSPYLRLFAARMSQQTPLLGSMESHDNYCFAKNERVTTDTTTTPRRSRYSRYRRVVDCIVVTILLLLASYDYLPIRRPIHRPTTTALSIDQRVDKILSKTPLIGRQESFYYSNGVCILCAEYIC